jgi:hypothetical protein
MREEGQLLNHLSLQIGTLYNNIFIQIVGASHWNLPHVKNFGDQVTLTQIGIQATAR